jgi:hypothetical protein
VGIGVQCEPARSLAPCTVIPRQSLQTTEYDAGFSNCSQAVRSHGQVICPTRSRPTVAHNSADSYLTFQSFFGLASLHEVDPNFYGLPEYSSQIVFEAVTNATVGEGLPSLDEVSVRFLLRNGSAAATPLDAFPIFKSGQELIPWKTFARTASDIGLGNAKDWCAACGATADEKPFCPAAQTGAPPLVAKNGDMSAAVAGVVGAAVTLGVIGLALVVAAFVGLRVTRKRHTLETLEPSIKQVDSSSSTKSAV